MKKEIRLTIWTRANSISQRNTKRIGFSRDAEDHSLAIRARKKVPIAQLGEACRRPPPAGKAKLHPLISIETNGRLATPKFHGDEFPVSDFIDAHHAHVQRWNGSRSCHKYCDRQCGSQRQ